MEYVHNSASEVYNCLNSRMTFFLMFQPLILSTFKHQLFTINFCTASCLNHSFAQVHATFYHYPVLCFCSQPKQSLSLDGKRSSQLLIQQRQHSRGFIMLISRKEISLQINSSLLPSTETNKTKSKILCFSDPRPRKYHFLVSFKSQGHEKYI